MAIRPATRILSIEDEPVIASRIERLATDYLGAALKSFDHRPSIESGIEFLETYPVDLLFLDLNLRGEDGFEVLEQITSFAAQTVVISAYADRAAKGFDYGVIDFITKPFDAERLARGIDRYFNKHPTEDRAAKYLSFRTGRRVNVVSLDDVVFARGADKYSEILLENGDIKLHDKSLNQLESVLPETFMRVHKSYLVNLGKVETWQTFPGNRMDLIFTSGARASVSRAKIFSVKAMFR
ncbi:MULTISPECIES: LytR/AlgR family response regulator transcription factor [Hyphobacterium]|uniref:LytR/AlgR family response regulator transcription factor n=1 Tax=Hyphobacterium vulgare TaxID=1736751 RepID=A0ABV6ZY95_9PROT